MRARGLKRRCERCGELFNIVAPHAGAWIETLAKEKEKELG